MPDAGPICGTVTAGDPRPVRVVLTLPDDWHLHLRDGAALAAVVGASARCFGRGLVMPNLDPPILTVAAALEYRARIRAALPSGSRFEPLMTLYLTESTTVEEIRRVAAEPAVIGLKLYPAGATTHSEAGVRRLDALDRILGAMEQAAVPLLVHGEVTDPEVDVFDRERIFIERYLARIRARFPGLRIVLEHVTTRDGVEFVRTAGANTAATLTAHHLLYNRNALLGKGLRPHFFCLPVLKRESHRVALLEAATSADPRFFLGTDSAPHLRAAKESACGCAGCYTAPAAIELYAEAFAAVDALDRLEGFASHFGPKFYGLPVNAERIALERQPWILPDRIPCGAGEIVPLRAGERVEWRVRPAV